MSCEFKGLLIKMDMSGGYRELFFLKKKSGNMEDHSMNNNPPSTFLDESAHLSWKSILSKSVLAAQA